MNTTRRKFLKTASGAALAPLILPNGLHAAKKSAAELESLRMGFIGMGKMSRGLVRNFQSHGSHVVAVCDVDTTRREDAKKNVDAYNVEHNLDIECVATNDYEDIIARDDIDAVCIATPDHWHAIPTVAALRSGKDVYCEKPLTHNIFEAVTVMDEVEKTGRILQTGSMQRSSKEFRVACELVRNGVIGEIERVVCSFGGPGIPCDLPEEEMEPGLDWDRWVGPAEMRPYNSILSPRGLHDHFPRWRTYREFGNGMVADFGAHHLDIAQWGLGMDGSGPVEIIAPEDPEAQRGCTFKYANGITLTHDNGVGIEFYGSKGLVQVNRGKFALTLDGEVKYSALEQGGKSVTSQYTLAEREFLEDADIKLYNSSSHVSDFLECVASRQKPITDEIVGGGSAICCHLMNIAYQYNTDLKWDPDKNQFADGTGDPKWLTRDYRASYGFPA
ncbi:MAG: Gfo/Idh/MocA family oxidoreductase [Verrucomicrobiota bacterium]